MPADAPNLFDPEFDDEQTRPGFSFRRAQLGRRAGGERLGASLYEIAPDSATYPHHYHLGWLLLVVALAVAALAASVYLVFVLEILKFKNRRASELKSIDPDTSEHEIDERVAHDIETGEFERVK